MVNPNRHIDFVRERILKVLTDLEAIHGRMRITAERDGRVVKIERYYEPANTIEVIEKAREALAYLDSKRVRSQA